MFGHAAAGSGEEPQAAAGEDDAEAPRPGAGSDPELQATGFDVEQTEMGNDSDGSQGNTRETSAAAESTDNPSRRQRRRERRTRGNRGGAYTPRAADGAGESLAEQEGDEEGGNWWSF